MNAPSIDKDRRIAMRYHLNFRDLNDPSRPTTRFHREAAKLQKHVADFRPDLVDLWGSIMTLPRQQGFAAHMRLHLPTGTLTAEGRGYSRFTAWNDAVNELENRLERHKARLQAPRSGRERRRRDQQRWHELIHETTENGFAVANAIQVGYPDLVEFIRTEVRLHEQKKNLPRRTVDPTELADEVAMIVLKGTQRKPADLSFEHWFFKVAYEQVMNAVDEARQARENRHLQGLPLDAVLRRPEGPEGLVDEDDLVEEWIKPAPRNRYGHDIPDPRSFPSS
jgi:ribosome-associated translation inhibitor RaiA